MNTKIAALETHVVAGIATLSGAISAYDPGHHLNPVVSLWVGSLFVLAAGAVEVLREFHKGQILKALGTAESLAPTLKTTITQTKEVVKQPVVGEAPTPTPTPGPGPTGA